jgi:hypothetical protein
MFTGCDIVEKPYMEEVNQCGDANAPLPIKRIVVEKFTGHKCGVCPRADEKMEELKSMYCDHIIPVSIHAGYFAEPNPSGKYSYDYRTTYGNEYDAEFGASEAGLPKGLINRKTFQNERVLSPNDWTSSVQELLQEEPEAELAANAGVAYGTRQLSVSVEIDFIKDVAGELALTVYLLEDSVVTWQKDYEADPPDIENYIHNHVLRKVLNGTWGETFTASGGQSGVSYSKSYNSVLDEEWKIENCSVVAFIYHKQSKEIIQATESTISY